MVDSFQWYLDCDDRTTSALAEMRTERRANGTARRLPALIQAIRTCDTHGDSQYHGAIAHWIASLHGRCDLTIDRRLKLPEVLREALGIAHHDVLLETNGKLWLFPQGKKTVLLYSSTHS